MSRWIDAEWLKGEIRKAFPSFYMRTEINTLVNLAPSIDIVRCKECEHWNEEDHWCNIRDSYGWDYKPDDFCSYGERNDR